MSIARKVLCAGYYAPSNHAQLSSPVSLSSESFQPSSADLGVGVSSSTRVSLPGELHNFNTLEGFKEADKAALVNAAGRKVPVDRALTIFLPSGLHRDFTSQFPSHLKEFHQCRHNIFWQFPIEKSAVTETVISALTCRNLAFLPPRVRTSVFVSLESDSWLSVDTDLGVHPVRFSRR